MRLTEIEQVRRGTRLRREEIGPRGSKLLGHKSITTTIRFYCGLEGERAAVRFDKIIEDQRQTLGFGAPKRKPGKKARKTKGGRR
jgi:hypothetical protein